MVRVLVIEDDLGDFALMEAEAREAALDMEFTRAETLADGIAQIDDGVDAILLDLGLPDSVGLDGLHALRARRPDMPVIVLTGNDDEATAFGAIRAGAQDYLVKGEAGGRTVLRALAFVMHRRRSRPAPDAAVSLEGCDAGVEWLRHAIEGRKGPLVVVSSIHAAARIRSGTDWRDVVIVDASGMGGGVRPDVAIEPTKLELICVHVERAAARLGDATVLVHTMDGLALYSGPDATAEFTHMLATRVRQLGLRVRFVVEMESLERPLGTALSPFVDEVAV